MKDLEFMSQDWWQGIGGILSALGIIITLIALYIENKKKKIGYRIVYSESLINVNKQVKNDLKIIYKDHEVRQLNLCKIQIINNGRVSIKKDDFNEPIQLEFETCENILDIKIIDQYPSNLKVSFESFSNKVLIDPLLFNTKEYFNIQIMFDGTNRDFKLACRIEGINEFNKILISKQELLLTTSWMILLPFIMLINAVCFIFLEINLFYLFVGSMIFSMSAFFGFHYLKEKYVVDK